MSGCPAAGPCRIFQNSESGLECPVFLQKACQSGLSKRRVTQRGVKQAWQNGVSKWRVKTACKEGVSNGMSKQRLKKACKTRQEGMLNRRVKEARQNGM